MMDTIDWDYSDNDDAAQLFIVSRRKTVDFTVTALPLRFIS